MGRPKGSKNKIPRKRDVTLVLTEECLLACRFLAAQGGMSRSELVESSVMYNFVLMGPGGDAELMAYATTDKDKELARVMLQRVADMRAQMGIEPLPVVITGPVAGG